MFRLKKQYILININVTLIKYMLQQEIPIKIYNLSDIFANCRVIKHRPDLVSLLISDSTH